mmetsp:Transcript_18241/g.59678  ORF Transcript_18241/g.59678 Transcript_18241/m.59678 type:complete len:214 (+) Transcript_18241:121-762(+)
MRSSLTPAPRARASTCTGSSARTAARHRPWFARSPAARSKSSLGSRPSRPPRRSPASPSCRCLISRPASSQSPSSPTQSSFSAPRAVCGWCRSRGVHNCTTRSSRRWRLTRPSSRRRARPSARFRASWRESTRSSASTICWRGQGRSPRLRLAAWARSISEAPPPRSSPPCPEPQTPPRAPCPSFSLEIPGEGTQRSSRIHTSGSATSRQWLR